MILTTPTGLRQRSSLRGALRPINDNDSRLSDPARLVNANKAGATPLGFGIFLRPRSQGRRVRQPWDGGRIPFGELSKLTQTKIYAGQSRACYTD